MRKKLSILFFVASISSACVQYFYQFDGTAGYLLVLLAVLFFFASIIAGDRVLEFLVALAEFLF